MRTLIRTTGSGPGIALGLLTGSYSVPEDFEREGFPEALERRGIAARIAMAEVRAAWFSDGSVVQRIRESVVEPARALGFARVWLAGISLGGLASLAYVARHGGDVERVALFSPYPGTREVLREIDAAGGLDRWRFDEGEADAEREAWRWLRDHGSTAERIDCYFATGDRFVEGQRRIAGRLPAAQVHERPGGHEWEDWRAMWNDFLERHRP
ncbi:MAG TPA: alpha/beta hydrolase-fold protein [Usitatibacter sp.]|jgi:pimeloyl-ACP methyl ester carboxylesterase